MRRNEGGSHSALAYQISSYYGEMRAKNALAPWCEELGVMRLRDAML